MIRDRGPGVRDPLPVSGNHPIPTNLPIQPTAFIGREKEVEGLRAMLRRQDVRLVSLIGPPGIGKTRLSLQVAGGLLADFPDGVFFVALSPVSDPSLVPSAIAQSLGLREPADKTVREALGDYIADRQLLLVLDNFEQVVPAGVFVGELIAACPRIKVLVSSRTVLRVYGRARFRGALNDAARGANFDTPGETVPVRGRTPVRGPRPRGPGRLRSDH